MNCRFAPLVCFLPRRTVPFLTAALLWLAALAAARAQSEDSIKAAFLYNFAKLTEWPASAFANDSAPVIVGFIGADGLADLFEKNVMGKNTNGREFTIKKLNGTAGIENCQMLFIGDPQQTPAVLASAKGKPLLTIGAAEGFCSAGGMINFVKDGAKVSFDLDADSLQGANLKLDGKLRQLARTVKGA